MKKYLVALALCLSTQELDTLISNLYSDANPINTNWNQAVIKTRAQSLRDEADKIDQKEAKKSETDTLYKRLKQHGVCQ